MKKYKVFFQYAGQYQMDSETGEITFQEMKVVASTEKEARTLAKRKAGGKIKIDRVVILKEF